MSNKVFLGVLTVVIVAIVGVFMLFNQSGDNEPKTTQKSKAELLKVTSADHVIGDENAEITLIEYGDFQCPFCATLHLTLDQVLQDEKNEDVRFVFRHFPLAAIHQNAMTAHRAVEAAGKQGKFFAMHDLVYERQADWSESKNTPKVFEDYAKELGLNLNKFRKDVNSSAVFETINSGLEDGQELGAESTPTLFLNGVQLEGLILSPGAEAIAAQQLQAAIDATRAGKSPNDAINKVLENFQAQADN